ncbi:hypothetical protein Gotur_010202 [Gossypium turneri]
MLCGWKIDEDLRICNGGAWKWRF